MVKVVGALVDGEHVQDEVLAALPGLVNECADEPGAGSVTLMFGTDFDAGKVDLAGAVFDIEHADVCSVRSNDLPAVRVEGPGVEVALGLFVPAPDRGDVAAHGGLVQLEAELAVGGGGRPQNDAGHAGAGSDGPARPIITSRRCSCSSAGTKSLMGPFGYRGLRPSCLGQVTALRCLGLMISVPCLALLMSGPCLTRSARTSQ